MNLNQAIESMSEQIAKCWESTLRKFFDSVWPGEKIEDHMDDLRIHGRFACYPDGRRDFYWFNTCVLSGKFKPDMSGYVIISAKNTNSPKPTNP